MSVKVHSSVTWEGKIHYSNANSIRINIHKWFLFSYAASFILDRTSSSTTFDVLYEAGRRGRSGDNCHQAYLECNEV